MEPNNTSQPQNPPAPEQPQVGVAQPIASNVPQAAPAVAGQTGGVNVPPMHNNKGKIWIIVAAFLVVSILIAVGIVMYSKVSKNNPELTNTSSAIQETVNTLSTEIQGVVIDDVSADFTEVDSELSNL